MGELHRAGKTIVLASHDLQLLPVLADRCIVFTEEHQVAATGTPDAVLGDEALLVAVNLVRAGSRS
jgi:cobalt/nickel transport system ATP-binding protein